MTLFHNDMIGPLYMPQDIQTFLTLAQAIDAVAGDFGQYGSQPDICRKIAPLILGHNFKLCLFNGLERAWIRRNRGADSFEPVDDTALCFYLVHMLETGKPDAALMARICTLVFQTTVKPGEVDGEFGIWVESQMTDFSCKRCGNCCRRLENKCSQEDRELWQRLGRSDILAWVNEEVSENEETRFRMWIDPVTGEPAASCPFLAAKGKSRFYCRIQDTKPLICREYPFTKKHAQHTGCLGFERI